MAKRKGASTSFFRSIKDMSQKTGISEDLLREYNQAAKRLNDRSRRVHDRYGYDSRYYERRVTDLNPYTITEDKLRKMIDRFNQTDANKIRSRIEAKQAKKIGYLQDDILASVGSKRGAKVIEYLDKLKDEKGMETYNKLARTNIFDSSQNGGYNELTHQYETFEPLDFERLEMDINKFEEARNKLSAARKIIEVIV